MELGWELPVLCQYSAGAEMAHRVRNSWPGKKRMGVDFGRDPAHMMDEGPRRVSHERQRAIPGERER